MGGSGYNVSLAAGRSVRREAGSRGPIWFWLDGPFHIIDMGCGPEHKPHLYRSRTPLLATDDDPEGLIVWCGQCLMFRYVGARDAHPVLLAVTGLPPEDMYEDKRGRLQGVAVAQDDNVLRERVGRELQNRGFVHTEGEIAAVALEFGVPVAEVKKINAGLSASDNGAAGQVEMCRAGKHEMSLGNVKVKNGRRACRACHRMADQRAAAAARERKRVIIAAQAA